MPEIIMTDRSGEQTIIQADTGLSLMEVLRNSGADELLALCGGVCSCATCHVYIDPAYADLLEPMSEDEDLLLDGATERRSSSRLSCQLRMTERLAGLRLTIAVED